MNYGSGFKVESGRSFKPGPAEAVVVVETKRAERFSGPRVGVSSVHANDYTVVGLFEAGGNGISLVDIWVIGILWHQAIQTERQFTRDDARQGSGFDGPH